MHRFYRISKKLLVLGALFIAFLISLPAFAQTIVIPPPGPGYTFCVGGGFAPIGNIQINENVVNSYPVTGGLTYFRLSLPAGFVFNNAITPSITPVGAHDFSSLPAFVGYFNGNTEIEISYQIATSVQNDIISIANLAVAATSAGSGNLIRVASTGPEADQPGNNVGDNQSHGLLTSTIFSITLASSDADNEVCTGQLVSFTATPTIATGSKTYEFFKNGLSVQGPGSFAQYTTALNDDDEITVTAVYVPNGCTSVISSGSGITTNVLPLPVVDAPAGPFTVCGNDFVDLSGTTFSNASGIVWASSGDGSFQPNALTANAQYHPGPNDIINGTAILTITTTGSMCTAASDNVNIIINPLPAPVITGVNAVCSGQVNVGYSTPAVGGHTYNWSIFGGTITSSSTADNITVTWGTVGTGTLEVTETITATGCEVTTPVYNVTKTDLVASLISSDGDNVICAGTSVTFTATPLGAATYDFRVNGSSVQSSASNIYTTTSLTSGQNVDVIVTLATGCFAVSSQITTTVNANPVPVLGSSDVDNTICAGNPVTFTATPAGQTNYEFFVNGLSVQNGATNTYLTSSLLTGQTVTVRITNASSCSTLSTGITTTVNPNPVVTLTSSDADNVICAGTSVTFTATPLGAATYDFRVNGSSVQSSASNIYTTTSLTTGQNVDVIVTLATGCFAVSSQITTTVNANPVPVLGSSDVDNTICAGNPVTFTATPAGQTNYEFFVNGLSVQNGATNTYLTSSLLTGQTVTVRITNASSCSTLSTGITTTVNPNPVVTLTSSDGDNVICAGTSVTFTATPLGAATYDFRVNGSSVQSSASNIYTTTALTTGQNVDVIVTLATGCFAVSSQITTTVNANPVPVLGSSDADNTICAGNPVTFTATPAGQTNYEFFVNGLSVQNGATNTYLTSSLLTGQTVTVRITNASSCSTLSMGITTTVNPNPVVTLTSSDADNVICSGTSVTFTATPLGAATYDFRVNGSSVQSSASNIYTTTALTTGQNVDVIVTLATGCFAVSSQITTTVNANPVPVLGSSDVDNTICAGNPVTFTATPAGQTNYEFFVNGLSVQNGATNTYLTSSLLTGQTVTVRITNASSCSTLSTGITTTVNPNPVVTLTSSDADNVICAGTSVTFTATPLGAATYDFRVNGSSVQSSASNIYTTTSLTSGQNVDVIVTLATGCFAVSSQITTTVNANPVPVLGSSDVDNTICAGNPVTFTATPAGQTNYEFFVNGLSVQNGATNTYLTSSLLTGQTVTVRITNASSCSTLSTGITTTVNPNPVVTLTSSDADNVICAGTSVTFTATPLGAATYDFRVNGSSVQSSASNIYTTTSLTSGQNVDVIVTLATGCFAVSSQITTTVNANPVPVLGSSDVDNTICAGNPVTFTATPAGQTNYEFFVNGLSVQNGATNTYLTSSLLTGQTVTVRITNASSCSTLSTGITTTVNPNPVVTLTSSDGDNVICAGTSVTFTATPLGAATYDFRVNGSSVQSSASNIYTTTALTTGQNVDVIVTLATGCFAVSSQITTTVNANPVPVLGSSDVDNTICAGNPVTFTATPAGQTNYEFFVNGLSVQNGATNTYLTSSLLTGQTVTVRITNASSCSTLSTGITTTVNPNPVVTLTSSDADNVICAGTSVTFTATPLGAATYDFRVNGSSVQSSASNIYTTTSLTSGQNVDVIVTLATGCFAVSSQITTTVNANPVPVLGSSDVDNTICAGNPVTFTATPAGQTNYEFFVNGLSVQNGATNTYLTSSLLTGQTVTVRITNASSCSTLSTGITTTVNPNPVVTLTSSDADNVICAGTSVTFTATPLGAATYDFRVNGSSVQSSASNIYTTTSLTTGQNVDVIVTLATGCFAVSSQITTTVNANPVPVLGSSDVDNTICAGNPVTFTATPAGQTNYEFFVNGLSVQNGATNTYLTSSLLTGQTVTVRITNASSCSTLSTGITTTVNPNPVVTLTSSDGDNVICAGTSVTFTATPLGAATYDFRVNGSSVQSSASNIYTTTSLTTGQNVDVIVTLATGCFAVSSQITTTVNANPVPVLGSSDVDNTICAGNPVTFTATPAGQTNYEFFVNGLSVQNGATNTYLTSSLLTGQTVTVRITNASSCSTLSTGITTTVNPNPVVTLTSSDGDNVICAGTSVTFTATPLGAATYDFRVNGSSVQSSASNIYTTTSLTTGQNVDVIVTLATGCFAVSSQITTTVNANPVPVLGSSDVDNTICAGNPVTFTATPAGQTNYEFFVNGLSVQNGATNTYLTSSLLTGQTVTVRITNASSCSTLSTGITTTVNPNPVVTLTSSDGDNVICAGTSVTFTATPLGAATYDFRVNGSSVQSSASNIYTTTALTTGQNVDVIVTLATGCFAVSSQITTTVNANPVPVLGSSDVDNTICAGNPVTFTATPAGQTNYEFFVNGLSVQNGATNTYLTSSLLTGQTVTVRITNASSCSTLSMGITTTVNPNPVVTLTSSDGDNVICAGTSVTFTATPLGAATYDFRVNGSSVQSSASNIYTTTALTTGQNVDVIVTLATGCFAVSSQITTTVNANPTPIITGTPTVCGNQAGVNYQVTPVAGVTYTWVVTGGTITGGAGTDMITVTWGTSASGTVQITETITITGCSTTSSLYNVTINPLPAPAISGLNTVCENQTNVSYSTVSIGGRAYLWTITGGVITSGAGTNSIAVTWGSAGTGTLKVKETIIATGCEVATSNYNVTINPLPSPVISGPATVCADHAGDVYTTASILGHTYNWTVIGGTITVNSGNTITVTWGSGTAGTIQLTETIAVTGCATTTANYIVTINPNPVVTTISNQVACNGATVPAINLSASTGGGETFTWTGGASVGMPNGSDNSSPFAIPSFTGINVGASPVTVPVSVSASKAGCTGPVLNFNVTVNPTPAFSITNLTPSICEGTAANITLTSPTTNAIITLVSAAYSGATGGSYAGGEIFTNGQRINETLGNPTESPITVTYTFSVSANGCTDPVTQSTQITINPAPPVFNIANPVSSICTGAVTNITLNTPTLNALVRLDAVTYGSATGSPLVIGTTYSNGQVIAQTLTNATNAPTTVTYRFSVSANGCNNPVQQQTTVVVNPSPTMSISNPITSICSGTAVGITLNSPTSGAIIRLTSVNYNGATGTLTAPQNYTPGSIITESLINPTNNPILVTYNFDVSANSCFTGGPFTTTVTVKPSPVFSIANLTPQVCEGSATDITLNTPTMSGQVRLDAVNYNGATGTLTAGALFTDGQKITEVLVNPTNSPITVTYTFSVSATLCSNPVQQQTTVSITRKPTVFAGADTTVCQPLTMPLKGKIGASAIGGLWSIVSGGGVLSATNVSGTTVTANYAVAAADVGNTITLRLTTNDPDGPTGPCSPEFDDIDIKINRAANITAGIDLAQCRDQASIALQGAVTYAPNGVSWSGGTPGGFGTITSPTSTYNFSPAEIGTNVTLTLTANDPDGSGPTGPCGIVTDNMVLRINQLPTVVFNGFPIGAPPQVAENAAPITLTGNQSGGIFTIMPVTSFIGTTTPSPVVDKVSFDPENVELGSNFVTYTFTDANNCTNSETQQVIINPVTDIDFTLQYWDGTGGPFVPSNGTGGFDFCANVGLIRIVGDPEASSGLPPTNFRAVGTDSTILNAKIIQIGPDYFIDTDGLPSGNYLLRYIYKNALGVTSAPLIRPLKVFASPVATIDNLTNNCIDSSILFKDASTLPATPFPNDPSTWSYRWNFGDGQFGNLKDQPHSYSSSGLYHVQLTVTTGSPQGCTNSTSLDIRVGDVPLVDFAWSAICTNDNTKFQDETDPGSISTIDTYSWDFGDGDVIITGAPTDLIPPLTHGGRTFGTYKNPEHNYLAPGSKNVVLSVETNDGCNNFKSKTISILVSGSTVTPDELDPYSNNFEVADTDWVAEGFEISTNPDVFSNTSWQFGVPTGAVINAILPANGTTSAWWTGANTNSYFPSEESAVNGPCFDLRSLKRPMVTLDYWSDAEQNLDGAALQYSIDGGLNWEIVGPLASTPNEGINWYKGQTVQSNPGRQPFGSNGWTGKLTGWKNARFNLDMILKAERDQVRLRVAFSSNNTNDPSKTFDGFAFDNIVIGERKRNVMVEYFTNGVNSFTNLYFDNLYANQFIGPLAKDSSDFFKIQYHLSYPSVDPINQENQGDPADRSLFYGISQPPSAIMDGILGNYYGTTFNGNYLLITEEELERRSLEDPLFDIKIDTLTATSTSIKFHIEFTYKHPTLTFSSPVTVHAVLLQDNVSVPNQKNIVRKFLLGTEGVEINIPWTLDHMESVDRDIEIDAPIGNDNDSLYLVAFIQDRRDDSKVIHQALRIKLNKKSQAVITGIDDPDLAQVNGIAIYPNPATRYINFATETSLTKDYQYTIVDQRGITVLSGNLNRNLTIPQQVELSNIADGVYIVMIHEGNRRLIQRKLAVLKR